MVTARKAVINPRTINESLNAVRKNIRFLSKVKCKTVLENQMLTKPLRDKLQQLEEVKKAPIVV